MASNSLPATTTRGVVAGTKPGCGRVTFPANLVAHRNPVTSDRLNHHCGCASLVTGLQHRVVEAPVVVSPSHELRRPGLIPTGVHALVVWGIPVAGTNSPDGPVTGPRSGSVAGLTPAVVAVGLRPAAPAAIQPRRPDAGEGPVSRQAGAAVKAAPVPAVT